LCNEFLNSPYRKTLPKGSLRLTEEGTEFVTEKRVVPIRIRCSTSGDLVVRVSGLLAQERSDGFVVGLARPKRSRLLDNTFFNHPNGQPLSSSVMAELLLHELTHCYYHVGTVSFGKGLAYYAEAVLLFRYRNHSMERLPYRTTAEFWQFFNNSSGRFNLLKRKERLFCASTQRYEIAHSCLAPGCGEQPFGALAILQQRPRCASGQRFQLSRPFAGPCLSG